MKKRFLASVLIAALGVLAIGCEGQPGTTENKTETKTAVTPATPDGRGTTIKKSTETTR